MLIKGRSFLISLALPLVALVVLMGVFFLYKPSLASPGAAFVVNKKADVNDGSCTPSHCTLREAILAANDADGDNTITFALPENTTITLNGTQLPPIIGVLTIDGRTAENLTISGNNASRVMAIGGDPPPYPVPDKQNEANDGDTDVTIYNLHITEGYTPLDRGAGIYNMATLTVIDSTFTYNVTKHGAIYNNQTLFVENSSFLSNTIDAPLGAGAGIFNETPGFSTITGSLFHGNVVSGSNATGGGAIYNRKGGLTVLNSSFLNNTAYESGGAGIYAWDGANVISNSLFIDNYAESSGGAYSGSGPVSLVNNTFDGNETESAGGAIRVSGYDDDPVTISGNTFTNNSASFGGALMVYAYAYLSNSTFSGNTADFGGAIYISDIGSGRTITMTHVTVSGNTASDSGGGIYNESTMNYSNSIIANNGGGDCDNVGTIGINIGNLVEDGSCNPAFSGDPLLGPLFNNGGPTKTLLPGAGSPVIDKGNNSICLSVDQRGWPRPVDGDDNGSVACDIGAVEASDWQIFSPAVLKP